MKFIPEKNPKYSMISLYVIGTVSILYTLYRLSNPVFATVNWIWHGFLQLLVLLSPLFWGFLTAYLLMPLTNWLEKKINRCRFVKKGKSHRTSAVLLSVVIVLIGFVALFSVLISTFTSQLQIADFNSIVEFSKDVMRNVTAFYRQIVAQIERLGTDATTIQSYTDSLIKMLQNWGSFVGKGMVQTLNNIPQMLSHTIFTLIFAVWFLLDKENIQKYWDRVLQALFPQAFVQKFYAFAQDADEAFSGYIRGQLMDALLMIVMISLGLTLCRVPYAFAIGLLSGVGNLVPYVGPFVAYASVIIVCLLNAKFSSLVFAMIVLLIIQSVDGNYINPKLLGKQTNIHPMMVMIALIVGGSWGGLLGMLFAVPITVLLKKLFDRMICGRLKIKKPHQKEIHDLDEGISESNKESVG